jgi:hypothetical protein
VEPDHFAMDVLAQRIQHEDLPPAAEGRLQRAGLRVAAKQRAEAVQVQHAEPLALAQRPVVIKPLEQIAGVARHGILGPGPIERAIDGRGWRQVASDTLLERRHIQPVVARAVESDRIGTGDEVRATLDTAGFESPAAGATAPC